MLNVNSIQSSILGGRTPAPERRLPDVLLPDARPPNTLLPAVMRTCLGVALLIAVACVGLAGFAQGAAADTCVWAADAAPWFPPGVVPVEDQGETKETCNIDRNDHGEWVKKTYRQRTWAVYLYPGYVYSHLMAMEDMTMDFVGLEHGFSGVTLDKSYARTAFYCVCQKAQCKTPRTQTRTRACAMFTCYVRQNHGEAHMAGITNVIATRTHLNITAAAGAEIGMPPSERSGALSFTVGLAPSIGMTVPLKFQDSQIEDTDAASVGGCGDAPVNDEEWVINVHTDGRCYAEGSPWQNWSDARAIQRGHYLWLQTQCECTCCNGKAIANQNILGGSLGVAEQTWTKFISRVGGKARP